MDNKQIKLVVGSLLHDIGKVVYRSGDGRNHSISGYDFLKSESNVEDKDILNQVRYHHANLLKNANIEENSLAYITYIADNIASKIDRRANNSDELGFDMNTPLESVFNILNGNSQNYSYNAQTLEDINYPTEDNKIFNDSFYNKLKNDIKSHIKHIAFDETYINSLIEVLEAYLSYVPSSTSRRELADISLYDHVKITAAIASCIYEYLEYYNIHNYKEELFDNTNNFYNKKAFILYSIDISGIQNFIYTISSKDALKMLRARSFYLEILMEHIIDELFADLGLSRANRIYAGGGHAYMLLPNTEEVKTMIALFEKGVNAWFLETFKTELYMAGGYCECSALELNNEIEGTYRNLFNTVSSKISKRKLHRYSAKEILELNAMKKECGSRECKVCKRVDNLVNDRCRICDNLANMSKDILNGKFFVILDEEEKGALPLPNNKYLIVSNEKELTKKMAAPNYVRSYSKNRLYSGLNLSTKLWVADHTTRDTFEQFAESAEGIKRIAVLRADVDNLGQAFISGFVDKEGKDTYSTVSRTATLSRQLAMLFKNHINSVLKNGEYHLCDESGERKITVVYSGGDDMFVVGSWNDIIGFSIDMYKTVKKYTQNTLTISAGIGVFHEKTPVSFMADETGKLEELSKQVDGKNAITIFNDESTYKWDVFIEKVLEEKYRYIKRFFENDNTRGKNLIYNILELIRNRDEKINIARYAYTIARLEPYNKNDKDYEVKQQEYKEFREKMYRWINNESDAKQLITAIYLYVYASRKEEDNNGEIRV